MITHVIVFVVFANVLVHNLLVSWTRAWGW